MPGCDTFTIYVFLKRQILYRYIAIAKGRAIDDSTLTFLVADQGYFLNFFLKPMIPIKPDPRSQMAPGMGTASVKNTPDADVVVTPSGKSIEKVPV